MKKHQEQCQEKIKCLLCGKPFETKAFLNEHVQLEHVSSKVIKCDYCDLSIEVKSDMEPLREMSKHHEHCLCKPRIVVDIVNMKCNFCEFQSSDESIFKRHRRDVHDLNTKSTSPKPKRRRKTEDIIEENMDVASVTIIDDE